jgi:diguanylate cyclase (GGDEF)-like protein
MAKTPEEVLKSIDILSPLGHEDLSRLYGLMSTEHYPEGQILFREGDSGETMYIVLSGSIAITVKAQDGEVLELARIPEGSFFGEMSIFDSAKRSATCVPKSDSTVLTLKAGDFYRFIETRPAAGFRVMQHMLRTTTRRLTATGAFLSDMVTWGEKARARAITDEYTGLYNRRFLEQAAGERLTEAKGRGTALSLMMLDLDHFATLNDEYGQEVGDRVLLSAVEVFRNVFPEETVQIRYGGDEFTFILPGTTAEETFELCDPILRALKEIEVPAGTSGSVHEVSASIGIAAYPEDGASFAVLMDRADRALYRAKEEGRARAVMWRNRRKSRIYSIKKRNQIVARILTAIAERDHFLLLGHRDPDEDCIASMIAMGLLIVKFSKHVSMVVPRRLSENFHYLLEICRYNEIKLIYHDESPPEQISTVFLMDTPKPSMREKFPGSEIFMRRDDLLRIEIDHHLQADSAFGGDPDYCLVDEASSASELVGLLALKLESHPSLTDTFNIQDIFTRNFVLAVLTGIIGDSKMGRYLKTRRERWYYRLFSNLFNEMLGSKTHRNSRNFFTMDQVFTELQKLSQQEEECFRTMKESEVGVSSRIAAVVIERESMRDITSRFDRDTIVTVARYTADVLAESSRKLGLVAYPEGRGEEGLIQFRLRRSQYYKEFDLRKILDAFSIENGGGHPGAIGFRIAEKEIPDLMGYTRELIGEIDRLLEG